MQYEWPLQNKDASLEEQLLSTKSVEPKIPKTEMTLNAVVEASKQIRNAVRQLSVQGPSNKPITPFTVTSADLNR